MSTERQGRAAGREYKMVRLTDHRWQLRAVFVDQQEGLVGGFHRHDFASGWKWMPNVATRAPSRKLWPSLPEGVAATKLMTVTQARKLIADEVARRDAETRSTPKEA